MNKIQLLTNLFNILLIICFKPYIHESSIIQNCTVISLCLNSIALGVFIFLFFYRTNREVRLSSLYFDSNNTEEIFNRLCKKVTINEGKFVFYWVWGANIDYFPEKTRNSDVMNSVDTEEFLDSSHVM